MVRAVILGGRGIAAVLVAGLACAQAQAIDVFQSNESALLARKQAIAMASPLDPIDVLTFTFRDGRSAREIVSLLAHAARGRQGIPGAAPVRFIVDGRFAITALFRNEVAMLAWAETQGVEVRVYNPVAGVHLATAPWVNHRKYFAVGDTVIFGGRNLAPHYLESDWDHPGFMDVDLRFNAGEEPELAYEFSALGGPDQETFKGLPLKRKLARLFDEMWESDKSEPLSATQRALAPWGALPAIAVSAYPPSFITLPPSGGWEMLRSEWDPQYDDFHRNLLIAIEQEPAGGEIYFESPYFMPTQPIYEALVNALARGVRFTLITNTFKTANGASKAIAVFMDQYYRDLLARGATLRFTQDRMLHAKIFSFASARLNYLGSHNAHRRSGLFDLETMLAWREKSGPSFIAIRRDFWNDGEGQGQLGLYRPVGEDVVDLLARLAELDEEDRGFAVKLAQKVLGVFVTQEDLATPEKRNQLAKKLGKLVAVISWIFEDPVGPFL